MTMNDDEGARIMNDEQLAAVKLAAKRRQAAIKAHSEASAVLADAARKLVRPAGPMTQQGFAELTGVAITTVRAWTGKGEMSRRRRSSTPG